MSIRDIEEFPARFGPVVVFVCGVALFLLGLIGTMAGGDPSTFAGIAVAGIFTMTRAIEGVRGPP